MITADDLYKIARSRYEEAKALLQNDKPDGAVYLCGYAMELILKRQIVKNCKWDNGYPETPDEFKGLTSFKTHNLNMLLRLSGVEKVIKSSSVNLASWQIIQSWDSELRYKKIGSFSKKDAEGIIEATKSIVNLILNIT